MSSAVSAPRKAGTPKPKKPNFNPARAINDRDWRRKQMAQLNASRASSSAGSPPPPFLAASRPRSKCINPSCDTPNVVDGTCHSCGWVAEEESNIVAEVQFGEASNGQAYAQGVSINHGEAGPRMNIGNGRRRVAGGGDGTHNLNTIIEAQGYISSIVNTCRLPSKMADDALDQLKRIQPLGFLRGRAIQKSVAAVVYWAVRSSGNTRVMLIDIADAIQFDVFRLGRTFKKLLILLYKDMANCPFEPLFPEDIIKGMISRLGFDREFDNVANDAVRIVQRMDRDWITTGRKPAAICGSAVMVAARMNNFRRTVDEISWVAKTTTATLRLRLEELARVDSAKMSVADFKKKEMWIQEAHDPPVLYRQSKEYQEERRKKKAACARKRAAAGTAEGEEQTGGASKKRRTEEPSAAAPTEGSPSPAQPPQPQTDADGFAIPALPSRRRSQDRSASPDVQSITEDDLGEADPDDDQDQEDALASKYGDVPLPGAEVLGTEAASETTGGITGGARTIRKGRNQGSALKEPGYVDADKEKWTQEEIEKAEKIKNDIIDTESEMWIALEQWSGKTKEQLLAQAVFLRPMQYRGNDLIDAAEVGDDEFANDPEVLNCLLTEEESRIKEQLWLNENKDWLRLQQEKEYKAKTAPPRKPRKNPRKPRIGEGQLTPASSAGDAAIATAKRLQVSSKINYDGLHKMLSGPRGPGSLIGSEAASRQTSRAGSDADELDDSDDDVVVEEDTYVGGEDVDDMDNDEDVVEDYDEQFNNGYGEDEFGAGDDDDY